MVVVVVLVNGLRACEGRKYVGFNPKEKQEVFQNGVVLSQNMCYSDRREGELGPVMWAGK